jgi:hypothetical protein
MSRWKAVRIGVLRLMKLLNEAKNNKITLQMFNEVAENEELCARMASAEPSHFVQQGSDE